MTTANRHQWWTRPCEPRSATISVPPDATHFYTRWSAKVGDDGTFRFDGQGRRFTGKFEAPIELQTRLLKEFR